MQILVLQRGWVVVGRVERDGQELVVRNASVVRRWGTKHGLGELALKGPQRETVMDLAGTCRVHELAVVLAIDCDEKKWPA